MISELLERADLHPSMLVGGILSDLGGNAHLGKGDFFVYEACEAFGSIDYLGGEIIVITNIDNDHMEFYNNMENLLHSFLQFVNRVSPQGAAVLNGDDQFIKQILSKVSVPYILFGFREENELHAINIRNHGFHSTFDVIYQKEFLGHFELKTPGQHNILNALASIAVALKLGISIDDIQSVLKSFTTPERRFQLYGKFHNSYIVDDYAHHPTEIAATIKTALEMKNSDKNIKRVIVAFQPHLYSRTEIHYENFAKELAKADFIVLSPIYEAREKNIHHISLKIITDVFDQIGFHNYTVSNTLNNTYDQIKAQIQDNDLVIIMGAGDIDEVAQRLAKT
jgi:UDP-N-acetylmuramate--alanine ligase